MKVLFLDESGDRNLSVIAPQYPMFFLGKVDKENRRIVESRFRRSPKGRIDGHGRVRLPQ